jgi:glucose 1-dehydrogenase
MGDEDIDDVLAVDLRAVIYGVREALRSFLLRSVAGSIVNVSSVHGRTAFPSSGPYDAAKGGVEALTRYVCVEYGHLGIRCNAVAPGAVNTSMGRTATTSDAPDIWPASNALSPMQRASEPSEVAQAILYLLSESAIAVNGHVLAVDNGMAARSYAFRPDPRVHLE